jgi:hypothetical protein
MHGRGERRVQDFHGYARRKETTQKTEAKMGGWDQNGSLGNWMGVWSGFNWLCTQIIFKHVSTYISTLQKMITIS